MAYKSDIELARQAAMLPIAQIAEEAGVPSAYLEQYGKYKAKVDYNLLSEKSRNPDGKLILVTAISPTPAGEGKTTVSVGLADALSRIGKKTMLCLREPSLGPVFGMKGGAAGGGMAQVLPMEDINLHFTGDIHAIAAANNLLAALLDNYMHHGNALGIDSRRIPFKRCMDMNDRQLRSITDGLGGRANGVPREDGFDIAVASEVMAVLCLSGDLTQLKENLARIIVGYTRDGAPVTAGDLKAQGAMAALLKDALKPNLVQTMEHTPALVHGGPFANIAHGCNSIMATRLARKLAGYVVTEAGFGADLGAEKFCDIKCRKAGFSPDAAVLVATVRALKYHGGVAKEELKEENCAAVTQGFANLERHYKNLTGRFGLPVVVAINRFAQDTPAELALVMEHCTALGAPVALADVWGAGGAGGEELAKVLLQVLEKESGTFRPLYPDEMPLREKIETIATKIYGARGVQFSSAAEKELKRLEELGFGGLPVCIAKTQYSFSDDAQLRGAPSDFEIAVRAVKISAGAGFVVALTGDIMTMPGLPKSPAAERIDVDSAGVISGLF